MHFCNIIVIFCKLAIYFVTIFCYNVLHIIISILYKTKQLHSEGGIGLKYIKILLCLLLVCTLFSGCSFKIASSIDELISPVSPFGENADIQKAMDNLCPNGYSLKNPNTGNFVTSYNFYDIDGDDRDEAFAFYEPADKLGTINLAILDINDGIWQSVESIAGEGKDIHSLDFNDVNGDGKEEVLICWDALPNSTNHQLVIYSIGNDESDYALTPVANSITINNYICVDMNSDKIDELMLFEINTSSSMGAKAELYSFADNKMSLLGDTKLDSHITSYTNVQIEYAEDDVRVYADAIGSDGHSMLTEVIYWSNSYDTIVSPFYSYYSGRTSSTTRKSIINSTDINDDGLIDIPTNTTVKGLPNEVSAIDWMIYKNTTLVHTNYSYFVQQDGYHIILPVNDVSKITASYDKDRREMTLYNKSTKKTIVSVMPVLKAVYNEADYEDYSVVLDNSGYYYLAKVGTDKDIIITIDNLKQNLKSVN